MLCCFFLCSERIESRITKILYSEENSKRKVPNQMTKSKAQTHKKNSSWILGLTFVFRPDEGFDNKRLISDA